MATTYKSVELFGGAIVADLPETFSDVSAIRQIPDNQEVHLDDTGYSSIVIEILERVDTSTAATDQDALEYHFRDLVSADDDDASETSKIWARGTAVGSKLPPNTPVLTLLATSPPAAKMQGRAHEPEFVAVLLGLVRLESVGADVLVAVNVPHVPGEEEGGYVAGSVDFEGGVLGGLVERGVEWRERVLGSFEVREWGLFGGEE